MKKSLIISYNWWLTFEFISSTFPLPMWDAGCTPFTKSGGGIVCVVGEFFFECLMSGNVVGEKWKSTKQRWLEANNTLDNAKGITLQPERKTIILSEQMESLKSSIVYRTASLLNKWAIRQYHLKPIPKKEDIVNAINWSKGDLLNAQPLSILLIYVITYLSKRVL